MIVTIRKILRIAVLAGMILFTGCRQTAEASGQLPLDIRARFGGIEITDTAYWDSPESTWFVLIRTPDRTNILLCFVLENGTWTQKFQTDTAVPQGEDRVSILFTDQVKESTDGNGLNIEPRIMDGIVKRIRKLREIKYSKWDGTIDLEL